LEDNNRNNRDHIVVPLQFAESDSCSIPFLVLAVGEPTDGKAVAISVVSNLLPEVTVWPRSVVAHVEIPVGKSAESSRPSPEYVIVVWRAVDGSETAWIG